jgi:hypothetical protein
MDTLSGPILDETGRIHIHRIYIYTLYPQAATTTDEKPFTRSSAKLNFFVFPLVRSRSHLSERNGKGERGVL